MIIIIWFYMTAGNEWILFMIAGEWGILSKVGYICARVASKSELIVISSLATSGL